MLQTKQSNIRLTLFTFAVIVLTVFVGCSNSPLGTVATDNAPQLLQRSSASMTGISLSPVNLHVDSVISASLGGKLVLQDVILDVPPNALKNDTLFSIDIPDINVFYNEFGTSGLVFDKPVKITMSYRDADLSNVTESTIRIGWFNEKTGMFDDVICDIDYNNKTVTGEVYHFSAYALISD
ncbi:MAG TPA: hypothetical protein ENH23_07565 [candidate division Zixibacteria bacterium]|nr:hypothetical protein [candidate division Zixibacteria bacterium]